MVKSNILNLERRKIIRKTWGKTLTEHHNNNFRTYFIIGKSPLDGVTKKVLVESEKYNDIIFVDVLEIFYNLPYKLQERCNYDYYLQVDDDMFINLPNIFALISDDSFPKEKVYLGYLHPRAHPLRAGKYSILKSEYCGRNYPPFVATGAILMSYDVIRDILLYFNTKPPFKLDDVYIGFLIYNMNITASDHKGFDFYGEDCEYNGDLLAYHSKVHTRKASCIRSLYNTMVVKSKHTTFINMHYKKLLG